MALPVWPTPIVISDGADPVDPEPLDPLESDPPDPPKEQPAAIITLSEAAATRRRERLLLFICYRTFLRPLGCRHFRGWPAGSRGPAGAP